MVNGPYLVPCPHCRGQMVPAARVCPHCRRRLRPRSPGEVVAIAFGALALIALVVAGVWNGPQQATSTVETEAPRSMPVPPRPHPVGEQVPRHEAPSLAQSPAASQGPAKQGLGPAVTATQPERPGSLEDKEAIVLMARLVAQYPTARSVTIRCNDEDGDNVGYGPFQLEWCYDRAAGTFAYRQANARIGVSEWRYSSVRDDILAAIAARAATEFVDSSFIVEYGCPCQQYNNGRAVPIM